MDNLKITVIIPTYNRAPILKRTLTALLAGQQGDLPTWEAIIVNDGSTDETVSVLEYFLRQYPGRLTVLHQENFKQGAARNNAMRHARGDLFVFLGDDIIPSPGFLAAHWASYLLNDRQPYHATIGRTNWHPEIPMTPFKEWINEWGLQFGFSIIENPENVPFNFFYTSNLSFARSLYDKLGGFEEVFREYGWEDIELGYRYAQRGQMILRHRPDALAYHHHDLSLKTFCRRQFKVGYSAVAFHSLYPELESFLNIGPVSSKLAYAKPFFALYASLLSFMDEESKTNINRHAEKLLGCYYRLGVLQARLENH